MMDGMNDKLYDDEWVSSIINEKWTITEWT